MTKNTLPVAMPDGEIVELPDWLDGLPFLSDEDLEELSVRQIAGAPTLEDSMKEPEDAGKLPDYKGEIITIRSVGLRRSDVPNARVPVYALLDVVSETKGEAIVSCGGLRVLAVLARAARENRIPLTCRAYVGEASSKAKSDPLYLVAVAGSEAEPF